jgi:hypothetical protein
MGLVESGRFNVMTVKQLGDGETGPWNPDIKSTLPLEYLPLSTLFRPENVFTTIDTATELSGFTGLSVLQLICFRPERLVVHELLIRVSADLFVSDGSKYEDLGVNYRNIVDAILRDYIQPHMPQIVERFNQLSTQVETMVEAELATSLFGESTRTENKKNKFSFVKLFKAKKKKPNTGEVETIEQRHQRILSGWEQKTDPTADPLLDSMYQALSIVANAIIIKNGRLTGDKALLTSLVRGIVCNGHGSEVIGEMISPYILEAVEQQSYRLLPPQAHPVVINVKGASASGKSTMRPLQQQHAEKLGLNWHDFALISPDIWRKYLLDYDALGPAYKYAGTLAGDEIPIIDGKLDRYIEKKAGQGQISHLLIDRFRFDSFAPGKDTEEGSNLLTRFGHTVYLIFMVTPPEATVERAWTRGLQVGRYKAVDDLLDHNIEAFKGITPLFFTWALRKDKTVYYEFLDNSVTKGEKPRTIAFGLNGEMYILDFKCMFDIMRYTRININANSPAQVYPKARDMDAEVNIEFLLSCAKRIPKINFVDRESELVYACMESASFSWIDPEIMNRKLDEEEARAGFLALAPRLFEEFEQIRSQQAEPVSEEAQRHTMGNLS